MGAWWLFHAASDPSAWLARTEWPGGALPLQHHIPNPFDALVLGPVVVGLPPELWWNGLQLGTFLANVAAAVVLSRAMGARAGGAALAGACVAASPLMLHEIAGGRTISGVVWPGLLALALHTRGRSRAAGLLLGLQVLCYAYTGALCFVLALTLRPRRGLAWAALPVLPYLLWLWPAIQGQSGGAPPAGHTALPVAGLLGLAVVPERFRVLPGLFPLALLGLGVMWRSDRRLRWLAASGLCLLVALGPGLAWTRGGAELPTPLAWLMWAIPGLSRMHHPVRAGLVLVPLMAVAAALGLQRLSDTSRLQRVALWTLALVPLLNHDAVRLGASATASPVPEGAEAARWVAARGAAVVDAGGGGGAALGLQPIHQLPMLQGLRRQQNGELGSLQTRVDAWARGTPQPGLALELASRGFTHVLAVQRTGLSLQIGVIEADLGQPLTPGVYALPVAQQDPARGQKKTEHVQ